MTDTSPPLPKPADPFPDDRLIELYVAGECTLTEHAAMERWIAAHPANGALLRTMRSYSGEQASHVGAERELLGGIRAVAGRIPGLRAGSARPLVRVPQRSRHVSATLGVFATLCALVGVSYWAMHPRTVDRQPSQTYITTVGKRAEFTLRDGTRVVLAPQSSLTFRDNVASLVGEAFFTVQPGTSQPLIVRTGNVTTRVLGTVFTVRRYADDASTHVAVMSGRVAVSANTPRRPSVTLAAGGTGVVTDSSATAIRGDAASHPTWVDGQLVFHEAPVPEVLAALTRWYGYQFRFADSSLARKKLTVWISTESSRDALATLKLTMGVDLSFEGTTVTLSRRGAARDITPRTRDPQNMISPRIREVGR